MPGLVIEGSTVEVDITPGDTIGLAAGTNAVGTFGFTAGAAALTRVKIDTASSGDITLVSATSSQTTKLYRMLLVAAGATTITVKDGAGTTLTGAMTLSAGGAIVLDYSGEPWFTTSSNTALIIANANAVQISGAAYYIKS